MGNQNSVHMATVHRFRSKTTVETPLIPAVLFGLCCLFPLNALGAETGGREKENSESYQDQDQEEMIVTGEKTTRSLLDTGSSAEIFDSHRIDTMPGVETVTDLMRMTTNTIDTGIGNNLPTVRGIDGSGPSAFLSGTRPRLSLSIDGRPLTYSEQAYGPQSLWDMDRVEIFRGPQSYIQGRNAIAGAIVMTSNDPEYEWRSAFKGGAGNQHSSQLAAMATGPLIEDQLAFRVSVDRQCRRSEIDLPAYDPVGDPSEIQTTNARAKLLFNPAGLRDVTTKLTFNHSDSGSPQNESLNPMPHPTNTRYDWRRAVFKSNVNSGIWDIGWEASDSLKLENRLIYTGIHINRYVATGLPQVKIDGREVHVEPIAHFGNPNSTLRGFAGLRYFDASQNESVYIFGGSTFTDDTRTSSAYGELTWAVSPKVDITASSRLEQEHRKRIGGSNSVRIDLDETYNVFLPKLDVAWKPDINQTWGARVARGYNAGGAGITLSAPYTSYTYDSEYVWNYELYTRHKLNDANVVLTGNIFYNDYRDMQLPYYLAANSTVIRNADKVETYGAELGATWIPRWDLEFTGNIGLLKTKIADFPGSGVEGHELARAPAYTANAGAAWQFASGWELSGNVAFSDSYYSAYDNDSRGRIGSYWTANAQLAYTFMYGRATLFAQNLFDSNRNVMVNNNDVYTAIQQRSRLVGAALELRF